MLISISVLNTAMSQKAGVLESVIAFVILAFAVYISAIMIKKHHRTSGAQLTLKAEFDSVGGLSTGSPVKINGVIVGSVQSIVLDPQTFSAIVAFSVDKSLKIPKDSVAAVSTESLLGGKFLSINPGSADEFLQAGAVIYRTQPSMDLEDWIRKILFRGGDSQNSEADSKEESSHGATSGRQDEEEEKSTWSHSLSALFPLRV
jgi:phospholipid/cholesterol/gamma-HCH transport system substrate-binding protein